ncbi:MAG: hypothetical protein ACXVY6_16390 [Gaiellaceae bacterium]
MSSLTNLVLGALLGVVIVAAFWLLASLLDDLRQSAGRRTDSERRVSI